MGFTTRDKNSKYSGRESNWNRPFVGTHVTDIDDVAPYAELHQ
jgi:hypothetical protein